MFDTIISWIVGHPYQVAGLIMVPVMPLLVFHVLPLLVLMERRGAAFIQDRAGPNRVSLNLQLGGFDSIFGSGSGKEANGLRLRAFGLLYNLTDAVKLLFKENFVPPFVHKGFYTVAPMIPMFIGLITPAMLPWFSPMLYETVDGFGVLTGQTIAANSGILMLFAISSLSVYGVVLGSWASNSKYSLLGGMRASAMMISYEVSMGLSVMGMLLIVGSLSLSEVAEWQGQHTWGIFVQPVGFLLFLVSMFAECNRNPFDVAEGESEIVAGFLTEFNGVRFMLMMAAEYLHMIIACFLVATVYLGGYHLLPFPLPLAGFDAPWVHLDGDWLKANLGLVVALFLAPAGIGAIIGGYLIGGRAKIVAKSDATVQEKTLRAREYGFYRIIFSIAGVAILVGAVAALALIHTAPLKTVEGFVFWPGWVNLVAGIVQFHVILGKALLLAWLFVWVRWTLPRFRYDQIMALGWKVMLNIALVNLLVTAIVAKLFQ